MHPYTIETSERKYIFLTLALMSLLLSWCFHKLLQDYQVVLPWWVESPSLLLFYSLLFVIFDRWLWKLFTKLRLTKTPNLSGEWSGSIRTSYDEHATEISANLRIFQTWTRIKVLLCTSQSTSVSQAASILVDPPEGKYLCYQFMNQPRSDSTGTMNIHRGTAELIFDKSEGKLIGEYYSGRNRQNHGLLHFEKLLGP